MFYGYWDAKGAPFLIGGTAPTPLYNNADVRACIQYEFSNIGSFCVPLGSQAATWPWTIGNGWTWAPARGEAISIGWTWGIPYIGSGARNRARTSIVNHQWPAIIGTGFYEHYPLAHGYGFRNLTATVTYWWFGTRTRSWVLSTSHRWYINNGQGNCSPFWVNANSCWFGTDGRCF